jgi:hypothetical protein
MSDAEQARVFIEQLLVMIEQASHRKLKFASIVNRVTGEVKSFQAHLVEGIAQALAQARAEGRRGAAMSDAGQARAQQLWESLKCDEDPVPDIAAALARARAEGRREGLAPILVDLKVSTEKLAWALTELGPTGTNAEAYVRAAVLAVIDCRAKAREEQT